MALNASSNILRLQSMFSLWSVRVVYLEWGSFLPHMELL